MTPTDTGAGSPPDPQNTGGSQSQQQTPEPKPDSTIQLAVDAAVASVRKSLRAGYAKKEAELQVRIDALTRDLEAAKGGGKPDEAAFTRKVEDALKPHLDEKAGLAKRIETLTGRVARAALIAAASGKAVEGSEEFVADALVRSARLNDAGEVEVVDADGMPRFGKGGAPMKVGELVEVFLAEKPFLAKSGTKSGLGFGSAKGAAGGAEGERARIGAAIAEADKAGNNAESLRLRVELARLVSAGK